MKLEQSFEVAAPLERVWQTLIDVEHVAPCLPGAAVTGRNDDGSYNGTFTVKIGPTTASYTGKLEMETIDEASHTATMQAQGTDKRGQGGAKATILSRLEPTDGHATRVEVVTDYHITGRLARFGRGGMIEDISERLLKEFAKRLQSSLAAKAEPPAAAPEAAAAPEVAGAPETAAPEPPAGEEAARATDTVVSPVREWRSSEAPTEAVPPSSVAAWAAAQHARPGSVWGSSGARTEFVPLSEVVPPSEIGTPIEAAATPDKPAAAAPEQPVAPPPPPAAETRPPLDNPPQPSEPMQGLSVMGAVVWGRVKRNPAPVAAVGVAVVLLMARRRRRRH
jgi:carbon monoxide dehydrogenase subunit G